MNRFHAKALFCSCFQSVCLATVLAAGFLFPSHHGWAALAVVDQQNTVGNSTAGIYDVGIGYGQTFTPSLAAIDAADITLGTIGGELSATVRLDLFSGAGFDGTLLGSSIPVTFTNSSLEVQEFSFVTPILLTPGDTYTLRVTLTATDSGATTPANAGYETEYAGYNTYSGGTFLYAGGAVGAGDLTFAEGIAVVPEPSIWVWWQLGIGIGIGMRSLRRYRQTGSVRG